MSEEVDKRIVELGFDGEQFEAGVSTSLRSLEELDKKLDLANAAGGFKRLGDAVAHVSQNTIAKNVASIADAFSLKGNIIRGIIQNLTNDIYAFGKNTLTKLSGIEAKSDGLAKYEQQLESIQTIIANTGEKMEKVNGIVETLRWYADETSYEMDDMTKAISNFAANGVSLDTAVPAIEGISNATAMAGQKAWQAQHAYDGFSKAIAAGKMTNDSWRWIKTARIDTVGLRKTFLDAAVAEGTLKEAGEGLYKTLKGNTVTVGNFNTSFKDGWLTANAIMRGLAQYGDFSIKLNDAYKLINKNGEEIMPTTEILRNIKRYREGTLDLDAAASQAEMSTADFKAIMEGLGDTALDTGRKAFGAAQEAKTWSDVVNTVKTTAQTGWARTYELIFGNYEDAKALFTGLANYAWSVVNVFNELRNGMLSTWRDVGGREKLIESLTNAANALYRAIVPVVDAFKEVFPIGTKEQIQGIVDGFLKWTESLLMSEETMEKVHDVAVVVFTVIKTGIDSIIAAWPVLKWVLGALVAAKLLGTVGRMTSGLFNLRTAVMLAVAAFGYFRTHTDDVTKKLKAARLAVTAFLHRLLPVQLTSINASTAFQKLIDAVTKFTSKIDFAGALSRISQGIQLLIGLVIAAAGAFVNFFTQLAQSERVQSVIATVISTFQTLFALITGAGVTALSFLTEQFTKLSTMKFKMPTFQDVLDVLISIGQAVDGIIGNIVTKFKEFFGIGQDVTKEVEAPIESLVSTLDDADSTASKALDTAGKFGDIFSGVSEVFGGVREKVDNAGTIIEGFFTKLENGTSVISSIYRGLKQFGMLNIFKSGIIISYILLLGKLHKNVGLLTTAFGTAATKIEGFRSALTGPLGAMAGMFAKLGTSFETTSFAISSFLKGLNNNPTRNVWRIAASVLALAGALFILTRINYDDIMKPAIALGVLTGVIVAVISVIAAMSRVANPETLGMIGGTLISFSASVVIFAIALGVLKRAFKDLSPDEITNVLIGFVTIVGVLGAVIVGFAKLGPLMLTSAAGILAFSVALGIFAIVVSAVAKFTNIFENMTTIVKDAIKSLLDGIKEVIKMLKGFKEEITMGELITGLIVVFAALGLAFTVLSKSVALVSGATLKTAIALLILYEAMILFKNLDWGQIIGGAFALGAAMVALASFISFIFSEGVNPEGLKGLGKVLLGVAIATIALVGAVKLMSLIPYDVVWKGLLGVIGLLVVLGGAINLAARNKPDKVAGAFLALVASIYLLIPVVLLFSALPIPMIIEGVGAIAVTIVALGVAVGQAGKLADAKAVAGIWAMVVGIIAIAGAMWVLQDVDPSVLLSIAGGIAAVFVAMGIAMGQASKIKASTKALGIFGAIIAFCAGATAMIWAMQFLKGVDWTSIAAVGGALAVAFLAFAFAADIAKSKIKTIQALGVAALAIGAAMGLVGLGFGQLKDVDWQTILAAAGSFAIIMGIFAAITAFTKASDLLGTAGAMLLLSGALVAFAAGLGWVTTFADPAKIHDLAISLSILVGVIGALAVVLALIPGSIVVVVLLAGAIIGLGVAALAAGAGVLLFGAGVSFIMNAINALLPTLQSFLEALPELVTGIGEAAANAEGIGSLGLNLMILAVGMGLAGLAAPIFATGLDMVSASALLAAEAINAVADAINAAGDTIGTIGEVVGSGIEAIKTTAGSAAETVGGWISDSLTGGLLSHIPLAGAAAELLGITVEEGVRDATQVHSESPLFKGIGQWISTSLASGEWSLQGLVSTVSTALGLSTVEGVHEGTSQLPKVAAFDLSNLLNVFGLAVEPASTAGAAIGAGMGQNMEEEIVDSENSILSGLAEFVQNGLGQVSGLNGALDAIMAKLGVAKKQASALQVLPGADIGAGGKRANELNQKKKNPYAGFLDWADPSDFLKGVGDALKEGTKNANDFSTALDGGGGGGGAAGSAKNASDEVSKMTSAIEDSIDMFNKFDRGTITSSKQIIRNLKSGFDGVAEWTEGVARLTARGFNAELVKTLTEEGPKSLSKVNSLLAMSFDEMNLVNDVYAKKGEYSKAVTEKITAAMKRSGTVIEEVTKIASESGITLSDNTKRLMYDIGASIDKIKVTYNSLKATVRDTVESQLDIFTKFEKKTETSASDMISNMKSQVEGVKEWSANLSKLVTKGLDTGLIMKLSELGPKGYDEVNAFVTMTDDQIQEANKLWAESLELPDTAMNTVANSFLETGLKAVDSMTMSLMQHAASDAAASLLGEDAAKAVADKFSPAELERIMKEATEAGASSIDTNGEKVVDEANEMAEDAVGKVETQFDPDNAYQIALNYVRGLTEGLKDQKARAELSKEVDALGKETDKEARDGYGVESPSWKAAEIGRYYTLGLALGLVSKIGEVTKAAGKLSEAAIDSTSGIMAGLSSALAEDVELMSPVITPVLDLSEIQNGAGKINGMFTRNSVSVASKGFNTIRADRSARDAAFANAVDNLSNINSSSSNVGDISINVYGAEGQDVNELADAVSAKLSATIQRRKAVWA